MDQSDVVVEPVGEASDELLAAWQRLLPQLSKSTPEVTESTLQEIIYSPATTMFAAYVNDQIVGCLTVALFTIPTGTRAWIEDVVVDESARGHGVGQRLIEAAIRHARASGARTVDLTSRPSREAANRLYQRAGFEVRETNVYRYTISEGE